MSERNENPSTITPNEISANQNDNRNEITQSDKSSSNLNFAHVDLNRPSIGSSSDQIDEKLGLQINDSNPQTNNTLSGRTSSSRLSERAGKPSFSLAGIFPMNEESGDAVGISDNVRDTSANDYTPLGSPARQTLLVTKTEDDNKSASDKPASNRQLTSDGSKSARDKPASSRKATPAMQTDESLTTINEAEKQNDVEAITLDEPLKRQSSMEQVSESFKIIRDMLTSPRRLLSPRGYTNAVNSPSDYVSYTAIDIRETKTEPPPVSEASSNSNIAAAPTGFSLLSPRIAMPHFPDFGYTKSVESFVKESRFAHWSREELILVLIHKNIHIRKQDEITDEDLIEYCDNFFDGKKLPRKRGPFKPRDWRRLDRGMRT